METFFETAEIKEVIMYTFLGLLPTDVSLLKKCIRPCFSICFYNTSDRGYFFLSVPPIFSLFSRHLRSSLLEKGIRQYFLMFLQGTSDRVCLMENSQTARNKSKHVEQIESFKIIKSIHNCRKEWNTPNTTSTSATQSKHSNGNHMSTYHNKYYNKET